MKRCAKCGVVKDAAQFHKHVRQRDGLNRECKPCTLMRNEAAKQKRLLLNADAERERAREAGKRFRDANVEKERERQRRRHATDPSRAKDRMRRWRGKNLERAREADKRWRTENQSRVRELKAIRRSAENAIRFPADAPKMATIYTKATQLGLEVDVVPLRHRIVCGLHVWHNLQLLDRRLNATKSNSRWPDMPEE